MYIPLKQIFEFVGERKEIRYTADFSGYEYNGTPLFQTPVEVDGEICNRAGVVTIRVTVRCKLQLTCDRCLGDFSRNVEREFEHILVERLSSERDDAILVENMQLDLDEFILSDILLDLPSKILCQEDCKGLCQICGANLNEMDCGCEIENN